MAMIERQKRSEPPRMNKTHSLSQMEHLWASLGHQCRFAIQRQRVSRQAQDSL